MLLVVFENSEETGCTPASFFQDFKQIQRSDKDISGTCHSLPRYLHTLSLHPYCQVTERKVSVYQLMSSHVED